MVNGCMQVKALLQEMANFEDAGPINQYQSMYDMVKRRSNKEREKEDMIKAMESRAKSLNQLAQVNLAPCLVFAYCWLMYLRHKSCHHSSTVLMSCSESC